LEYLSKKKIVPLMVVIAALMFCSSFMNPALAQECAVRVVAPSEVDPNVSTTFMVSIVAENIPEPGFYGWEVKLSWTPTVVNCTGETINNGIWESTFTPWVLNPINNVDGVYHQSVTAKTPSTPKTGTYWLVNLTFLIVGEPPAVTSLTIAAWPPATYCLATMSAEYIPHQFISATVNVVPEFNQIILVSLLMLMSLAAVIMSKTLKRTK